MMTMRKCHGAWTHALYEIQVFRAILNDLSQNFEYFLTIRNPGKAQGACNKELLVRIQKL